MVGGDEASTHEFRVEDDLLRLLYPASPSLLEFADDAPFSSVLREALDHRRMLRWSLKKEGILPVDEDERSQWPPPSKRFGRYR